jgi:hypothetical protein
VVITALTLFSGCVEEDEDRQFDLGEPVKEVNHIVGTEGFNVDVDDIFGEKSIYYLADYDEQQIRELGVDIEDSYLPKDKIPLMIKKLPDGTYDLSDLTESTKALGWEHISLPGYFPGSDKNPEANDNIIGNNRGKPELRTEMTIAADGERLNCITIFNEAYLHEYEEMGFRKVLSGEKFPDKGEFFWANKEKLKEPIQIYKKLFGDLCYSVSIIHPRANDALTAGSPDYEYGTAIKKKSA